MPDFITAQQFDEVLGKVDAIFSNIAQRIFQLRARFYTYEAKQRLHEQGKVPRMPIRFLSQYGEDAMIWEAFEGATAGLYIEVGAFDGQSLSVSYALDGCGWDGLLVEAIPERYTQCQVNRPYARVEHAILTSPGAPPIRSFNVVDDAWGGMFSYGTTTELHKATTQGLRQHTVSVRTATMDDLLTKHFPGREVDVAVIDVEGGELDVLGGFDLNTWRPKMLIIEDNSRGADPRLREFFQNKPYTLATWLEVNAVYIRNDQSAMLSKLMPSSG